MDIRNPQSLNSARQPGSNDIAQQSEIDVFNQSEYTGIKTTEEEQLEVDFSQ